MSFWCTPDISFAGVAAYEFVFIFARSVRNGIGICSTLYHTLSIHKPHYPAHTYTHTPHTHTHAHTSTCTSLITILSVSQRPSLLPQLKPNPWPLPCDCHWHFSQARGQCSNDTRDPCCVPQKVGSIPAAARRMGLMTPWEAPGRPLGWIWKIPSTWAFNGETCP
jgi:hypothetical protein